MAAIINGAAGFRGIVYSTEVLPFGGSHLGARCARAWRGVLEEGDEEIVCADYEEAAEFVKPKVSVGFWWRCSEQFCCCMSYRLDRRRGDFDVVGMVVIKCGEVLLQLKGRIEVMERDQGWARGHFGGFRTRPDAT